MSSIQRGRISEKSSKEWHGTMLYSFQLEGIDRWFRTGQIEIPQIEGTVITFEERNNKVVLPSLVVEGVDESPIAEAVVPDGTSKLHQHHLRYTSVPGTVSGSTSASSVGDRIRWQAARRDAVMVVVAALRVDPLVDGGVLPWAKNTPKAKRLPLLLGYMKEITEQLIEEEDNA